MKKLGFEIVSIVFNISAKTLSNWACMECFWNPQGEQIPKLSLVNQFEQDLKKKTGGKDVHFLLLFVSLKSE